MALVVQYHHEDYLHCPQRADCVRHAGQSACHAAQQRRNWQSPAPAKLTLPPAPLPPLPLPPAPSRGAQKPWSTTYAEAKKDDVFHHVTYAIAPSLALAVVFNETPLGFKTLLSAPGSWAFEVAWAFSIYLEAIAFLPQITMSMKQEKVEGMTSNYMASLGAYRAFYLANWVWRYYSEPHYWAPIPWVAGVVQTLVYSDFLWIYFKHFKLDSLKEGPAGMTTYLPLTSK